MKTVALSLATFAGAMINTAIHHLEQGESNLGLACVAFALVGSFAASFAIEKGGR